MGKSKPEVVHLKCCKRSSAYKPDVIRAHPFDWINFPIFVAIWFLLYWVIIVPIVWSQVHGYWKYDSNQWPLDWHYIFWSLAILIFCVILGVLILLWKCAAPKSRSKYDQIFLNPEYGDEKEILCIHCMSFHPPGGARCPCNDFCAKCGNTKETFNSCCQKLENKILKGPDYDVSVRKQQPQKPDYPERVAKAKAADNKRTSLKSTKSRNSSSSSFVILSSAHEKGTKDLINRKSGLSLPLETKVVKESSTNKSSPIEATTTNSVKSKKPSNLQPVDVDLANRHANVEFFGEKIPLGKSTNKTTTETVVKVHYSPVRSPSQSPPSASALKTGSVGSMESMDKKKFSQFLHLVEINTPFTPEETVEGNADNPPMSPREIFFYDLIQAADKCENGNSPDSTHFGFYNKLEKKRPVSHILVSSDVNLDEEPDKAKLDAFKRHTIDVKATDTASAKKRVIVDDLESPRILALTEAINLHTSEADEDEEKIIVRNDDEKNTTVKIFRTSKKSTPDVDGLKHPPFGDRKSFSPRSNGSSLSEQNSTQELRSLTKESVSRYFISDTKQGPQKPSRQNSNLEPSSSPKDNINDDVFSD